MDANADPKRPGYAHRIQLLEAFHTDILRWFHAEYEPDGKNQLRQRINKAVAAARQATIDAGCFQRMTIAPPPAVGGMVIQNADMFDILFDNPWGRSVIPNLADTVEQAIGVYEHLSEDTGVIRLRSPGAIDLETAIERALRPSFRRGRPESETDVQDSVQDILNSLGVRHVRDKEVASIGPRASRPDFTIDDMDLAIEVKLASPKHAPGKVQEEINADVSAYRTKWQHLLFVVYDLGVIDDPYQMRQENLKHYGVSVVVVKH